MVTIDSQRALELLLHQKEIENFFYYEADLLDQRLFEEWLDLLTEDIHYWMPTRRNVKFGEEERENSRDYGEMNWFDEGKPILAQRIKQIRTGVHWAEEPRSRVTHMVSNVRVVDPDPDQDEAKVTSRFLYYRNRVVAETNILVGKREDLLRRVDGQWKLAKRKILLDQNVLTAKSITVIM